MHSVIYAVLVASMIFGLGSSSTAANGSPIQYDCDTKDGTYSNIEERQDGPDYSLQAEITAKRLGGNRDWLPIAKIQIKSADGKNSVAIQLAAGGPTSSSLAVSVVSTNKGERKQYLVTTVGREEPVRASIRVKDGAVRAEVAGQLADIPIKIGSGAEVGVGCSTGQFMFERLSWGAAN